MAKLINEASVKKFAREYRHLRGGKAQLRIGKRYLDMLNRDVEETIRAHVRVNGSHATLQDDVFLGMPSSPRKGRAAS